MTPEEYQNRINDKEYKIIDALGIDLAFREVVKALSSEQREDIYDYIIKNWDLDYNPEGGPNDAG